ncbi:uncharacterized protein LOC122023087 [Zingiber officinale]|uniref:uncharacterized protein LOC122023087 n=1 Tax=Zingiber officinale TaxID=94328 RepID=UPI001C4CA92C|nr:uncharacterized protein LOC122023087 [Zingiber officinale]
MEHYIILFMEDEEVDRSFLWRKAREDKSGNITNTETAEVAEKIDDLLDKKKRGEFISSGSNDVLTTALGSQEPYGRVRGVGGFVKPQVYFKTPRKKRELVSKALAENFKEQAEETKILKAEVEKLKALLARFMPETSDRVSERVASNKSSHMAVQILEYDVEVFECDNSFNQGKKMSFGSEE